MRARVLSLMAASLACAPAAAQQQSMAPGAAGGSASPAAAAVRAVADEYVAEVVRRFPGSGEVLGDHRSPDRWTDNSVAALRDWERAQDAFLARLKAVDGGALYGSPEWLIHGMLSEDLEAARAQRVCRSELWAAPDQIFGWHLGAASAAATQRVGTAEDRARALARYRDLPRFVDTEIAKLREGLAAGYTAPRENVRRVIDQLDGMTPDDAAQSPFFSPALRDSTPGFRAEWESVVRDAVYPALERYRSFLQGEILPRARTQPGLSALPNGRACYQATVRGYTSLDVAPEEMTAAGRRARTGLEAQLSTLLQRLVGTSEVREGRRLLKADSTRFFASREARLAETRAVVEEIRAQLPRLFSRVPTTPLAVEPAPEATERSRPPAWYDAAPLDGSRPATYYVNLYQAERSPRMDVGVGTVHEGWPGHHLQVAWVREKEVAHPALRLLSTSAFVEGWAMYAELLAYEEEIFREDLRKAGLLVHLTDALVALEIDPAMHAAGMTREAAVDSMVAISGRPRAQAESYADRHAATPAQLVTYMTGYLEIVRLRDQAKRELGSRFDLRAFHDVVLDDGAVTLPMLRWKVERWIAERKAQRAE